MASPLFCKRLRHDLCLELFLHVHPAQAPVFFLKLLELCIDFRPAMLKVAVELV